MDNPLPLVGVVFTQMKSYCFDLIKTILLSIVILTYSVKSIEGLMHYYTYRKVFRLKFVLPILVSLVLMTGKSALAITADSFLLITNLENSDNLSLKRSTLRSIYSMQKQSWPNGERLTVFVLADDESLHEAFCQQVLGVLPYQLRKSWDRLIFSGKAGAPIRVDSIEEMRQRVANTPGAIGYITQDYVDGTISVVEVK